MEEELGNAPRALPALFSEGSEGTLLALLLFRLDSAVERESLGCPSMLRYSAVRSLLASISSMASSTVAKARLLSEFKLEFVAWLPPSPPRGVLSVYQDSSKEASSSGVIVGMGKGPPSPAGIGRSAGAGSLASPSAVPAHLRMSKSSKKGRVDKPKSLL